MSNAYHLALSAALLGLALSACHQPEPAAKTEADVNRAVEEGQAKVNAAAAATVRDHIDNLATAQGQALPPAAIQQDLDNVHRVETELAKANLRVAQEKCDADAGRARSDCLKLALLHYEAAVAEADSQLKAGEAELKRAQPPNP